MDETKRKLVVDLVVGRISEESFVAKFGADPRSTPDVVGRELEQALAERSDASVDCAMLLGSRFGLSPSWTPVLCMLLEQDWHHSHEDIADALQDIRDPSSVSCLYRAAQQKHEYLAYNDSSALAVKCIWALHDIGTAGAIEKLELLSSSDSDVIREKALERLDDLVNRRADKPEPAYRRSRNTRLRPDGR